jgi:hypothetical protein
MFFDESLVTILFQLINFALFMFLIWYVCKKYLIGQVKQAIEDKQHALVELHTQASILVDSIHIIQQAIEFDERMCHDLKIRVNTWRVQAEQQEQESVRQRKEQLKQVIDRIHVKEDYLKHRNVYERVLPQVINQAHNQLEHRFENEMVAEDFMAHLIASMQKGE